MWCEQVSKTAHALCTPSLKLNTIKAEGGRWGFPLKPQKAHFCGRNKSFSNQVLFALRIDRGADATLTNLFNPTSRRYASHPYLISTWSKEWCTIVCVMWASLKNCARMHYALLCLGSMLCTPLLKLNAIKAEGGRWGFPLKPQNAHFCGRNESFQNQVLFALRMGRGADATLTNLFNLTSGRYASHPYLIST